MVDFGMPDLPGFAPPSHSKITLVPTAQGIKAFQISFAASLPINLALILENALTGDPHLLDPVDDRMIALHIACTSIARSSSACQRTATTCSSTW